MALLGRHAPRPQPFSITAAYLGREGRRGKAEEGEEEGTAAIEHEEPFTRWVSVSQLHTDTQMAHTSMYPSLSLFLSLFGVHVPAPVRRVLQHASAPAREDRVLETTVQRGRQQIEGMALLADPAGVAGALPRRRLARAVELAIRVCYTVERRGGSTRRGSSESDYT